MNDSQNQQDPSQNTSPDAQEGTQETSSEQSRVSMQSFQENAASGLVVPQSSNDTEHDLNDTDDDEQPSHHDPDHTPVEVPLDAPDAEEQGTEPDTASPPQEVRQ